MITTTVGFVCAEHALQVLGGVYAALPTAERLGGSAVSGTVGAAIRASSPPRDGPTSALALVLRRERCSEPPSGFG